jgi:hypothetical protein
MGISFSHPWGGLVIDKYGNIYFTFVSPMAEFDHYACVWKIDKNLNISEFLKSPSSPSDIILSRSLERKIFAAERLNHNGNFTSRLWRLNEKTYHEVISRTKDEREFLTQAFIIDDKGNLVYAVKNRLFSKDKNGITDVLDYSFKFNYITNLAWGPDSSIYILGGDRLLRKDKNNELEIIATSLKQEDPEDLPFAGANIIFDMTVDEEGNVYLAYYGNKRILKILPNGKQIVYSISSPWIPHGIDYYKGEIYILESRSISDSIFTFWKRDRIIPRVRKIDKNGKSSILYEHKSTD